MIKLGLGFVVGVVVTAVAYRALLNFAFEEDGFSEPGE